MDKKCYQVIVPFTRTGKAYFRVEAESEAQALALAEKDIVLHYEDQVEALDFHNAKIVWCGVSKQRVSTDVLQFVCEIICPTKNPNAK